MSKQRTEKQIEASRINGAKSRGPVTPEGKRRSSRNALRHGRLASSFVLSLENDVEFRESLRDLCNEHQPATPTEHHLVEAMAIAQWQQYRIMSAAAVAYDTRSEIERQNPLRYKHHGAEILSNTVIGALEDRPVLTTMNVERSRLQRDYIAALSMLTKLQDRRERRGLSPVVQTAQESDSPEFEVSPDLPEATPAPIGLKNETTCAEIPATSLKTNETPRVPFSQPTDANPHLPACLPSGSAGDLVAGSLIQIPSTPEDSRTPSANLPTQPFALAA